MLDYAILGQKPTVTAVKDNEYVTFKDLLTQTYNGKYRGGGRIVEVEEYYVARPDLISLAVYGDDKYADILCKINGISNPFELNKGMYLFAPDSSVLTNLLTGTRTENDILERYKTRSNENQFNSHYNSEYKGENKRMTGFPASKNVNETIDKQRKQLKKYKNERRSPGDQTVMDNNFIIDRTLGIVIY